MQQFPTWQPLQTTHDLLAPFLHRNSVIAHHQGKHHQGDKLAGIGLVNAGREREKSHHYDSNQMVVSYYVKPLD